MCSCLEGNVAEFKEEVEMVDQGYQVQESFEQGKLPPNLQFMLLFSNKVIHQSFLGKRIKPCHLWVIRYFATELRSI